MAGLKDHIRAYFADHAPAWLVTFREYYGTLAVTLETRENGIDRDVSFSITAQNCSGQALELMLIRAVRATRKKVP